MSSHEFSLEPLNLLPQNRCFVRGFRQFSAHLTKYHAYHGICTLSPLDAALPMRFAKNTQHDTPKMPHLPRKMTMDAKRRARLPPILTLSTRYKTGWNVTKRHTCHAKRSDATCETTKNDPFCRTYHRHGHVVLTRTVANGCGGCGWFCGRLRTVANGCERLRT